MKPYAYFELAEWLMVHKKAPESYRSIVSRAYYSALHSGVDLLAEMGVVLPRDANKHDKVPDLLEHTDDKDVKEAGGKLSNLCKERNHADYDIQKASYETATFAELRVKEASDIIAKLNTFKITKGIHGGRFEKAKGGVKKQADFLFLGKPKT